MSNVDKMRDALEHCRDYFYDLLQGVFLERQMAEQMPNPNMDDKKDESELLHKIEEALAAPPRNCDIGTGDDQMVRFRTAWERAHRDILDRRSVMMLGTQSRWLQMPYKPEEDNK